ncbi:MAG: hypothetical protein WKF50_00750 [Nocardioides sp.]
MGDPETMVAAFTLVTLVGPLSLLLLVPAVFWLRGYPTCCARAGTDPRGHPLVHRSLLR